MLIERPKECQKDLKVGDVVIFKGETFLVVEPVRKEYNIIHMSDGVFFFAYHRTNLEEVQRELIEKGGVEFEIYPSNEYSLVLRRRSK